MLGFWPCCACCDESHDTTCQSVSTKFMYVTMNDRLYSACQIKKVINQWHIIYVDAQLLLQQCVE